MNVSVDNAARTRKVTYFVLGMIFLILAGTGLWAFQSAKASAAAQQKADQLIGELSAAGLRAPSKDQIVTVLGDDGGAICADPNSALKRATAAGGLTNGAGGPGQRPVIADDRAVKGTVIVIKVYCPQELAEFQEYADDLKLDEVVKA